MSLEMFANRYIELVDGSDGYRVQIEAAIKHASKWAGKPLEIHELSTDLIHAFVVAVKDDLAPATRRARRNILIRLASVAANDTTLLLRPDEPIRSRIARVKLPQSPPDAWTIEQVRKLLKVAESLRGAYKNGVPRRLYCGAYIRVVWDAGWRGCDVRSLERDWIGPSGRLAVVQRKTKRVVYSQLRPKTVAAIRLLLESHESRLIFPPWKHISSWRKSFERLICRAGLDGTIGMLRHSAGTAAEEAFPGQGHLFLGNSRQVFERHYLDRRISGIIVQPPEL